jgi:hypothetical protein
MPARTTGPAGVMDGSSRSRTRPRRRTTATVRRRRLGCAAALLAVVAVLVGLGLTVTTVVGAIRGLGPPIESGPDEITGIPAASPVGWRDSQPEYGVDVSFPQCGRVLRDMADGFAIVGLDGGMPDRPNPCFAEPWRFARAQGTPVWLDVELPEVWRGSQPRHRAVITAHLRVLAEAGYPVGVYSAPALWAEITGDASLDVPTWVGIGRASRDRASATCERASFGGRRPDIVQRIGTGSDGRPLDRNLVCRGTDLTGLVRPRDAEVVVARREPLHQPVHGPAAGDDPHARTVCCVERELHQRRRDPPALVLGGGHGGVDLPDPIPDRDTGPSHLDSGLSGREQGVADSLEAQVRVAHGTRLRDPAATRSPEPCGPGLRPGRGSPRRNGDRRTAPGGPVIHGPAPCLLA